MCTSNASKPARSNAAAISTWPLTPCSRRIATRGRAPRAMNGAARSSSGSNVNARRESRIAVVRRSRVFLRRPRPDCRAAAASRASSTTMRDADRRAPRRARSRRRSGCACDRPATGVPMTRSRDAGIARRCADARRRRRVRTCTTAPSSSANSAASGIAADRASVDVEPAARRERHLRERDEQAAVADVVIGEQHAARVQPLHEREERGEPRRIVEVRRARCRAGRTPAPAPSRRGGGGRRRCRDARSVVSPLIEPQQRRQARARVGDRRERRDDQRHRRRDRLVDAAVAPRRAHRHRVLADRNRQSDARRTARARPRAPCRTARRPRPDVRPRAIQFAESLTSRDVADAGRGDVGDRLGDRHAARRRRVDQRERRALADRHRLAGVAREIHERHGDVGDRHLPRPDHRIARAQAADRAIADRDEERLVGDRGKLQHAIRGVLDRDAGQIERRQRARDARHVARHLRRLAEDDVERNVDRRVAEVRIVDDQSRPRHSRAPTTANGQRSRSQIARNRSRSAGAIAST